MNTKASGRSALILAAGLWMCIAGPMRATESDAREPEPAATADSATDKPIALSKYTKHRSSKKSAKSHNSDKAASKASEKAVDEGSAKSEDGDAKIPASIANANAQLPAETPTDMSNMATQADSMLKLMGSKPVDAAAAQPEANTQVVAADQLNEVDRALSEDKPALTLARATIDEPVVTSRDNTAWDQTSLIGKVFIAFGGLLTMASAARMFMA
ncbi:MAG: hypothetical protein JWR49_467 [Tardiphaga sp.]|jgi:hypothetical protein|nr:hypothetical protein [Tardiphaga sp.]